MNLHNEMFDLREARAFVDDYLRDHHRNLHEASKARIATKAKEQVSPGWKSAIRDKVDVIVYEEANYLKAVNAKNPIELSEAESAQQFEKLYTDQGFSLEAAKAMAEYKPSRSNVERLFEPKH